MIREKAFVMRTQRIFLLFALLSFLSFDSVVAPAQEREEKQETVVFERFLSVLNKNPRKGTAFDRVYGYQVERGKLATFIQSLEERTRKEEKDGAAWMILGLFEAQRGNDSKAAVAFQAAEKLRENDPLASYYLGQTLVVVGQPDAAIQALERAAARKPPRTDLIEILQFLGRVHQRSQKPKEALEAWSRVEKLFPDDLRVRDQIAQTLVDEGQYAEALPRYLELAKQTTDEYRKVNYLLDAAELKVRLSRSSEALVDFESVIKDLNPDNWLFREVRRKVEDVFLKTDDVAGLCKYYETWLVKQPEDVDAMARLARYLSMQARSADSQKWLEKSLKLAPSRKELRLALIEQLVFEQKFKEAAAQYEALDKIQPNSPDYVREWGRVLLKDFTIPEPERKKRAAEVWRRLSIARPKDAHMASQLAELFRQSAMPEEAMAEYRRAIELAPDSAQYLEYLGEYLHSLDKKNEALVTWRKIAEGANRNAKNLERLAEVLTGFGYIDEAVGVLKDAAALDATNYNLQLKYGESLFKAGKFAESIQQYDLAAKLANNPEEKETCLQREIQSLQSLSKLESTIADYGKKVRQNEKAGATEWYRLASYLEAARMLPEAVEAIEKSLSLDASQSFAWLLSARIYESSGSFLQAAQGYRKLAELDRRHRAEYYTNVAKLESRLGRNAEALAAGREVLAAAPGNSENYRFYSDLCFQLGEEATGLDSLRRAVRANPTDANISAVLGQALSDRAKHDEAIELYWRSFERATEVDSRLAAVTKLAELYGVNNRFEKLVERLERERREEGMQREMTICLSRAYQSTGDYGAARRELQQLLAQNPRDVSSLKALTALSEAESDLTTAIHYQRQIVRIAPTKENESDLAGLLIKQGEEEEAQTIFLRSATQEKDTIKLLKLLDQMIKNDRHEAVLAILEPLLRAKPNDWELLQRALLCNYGLGRKGESNRCCQALLGLNINDQTLSALEAKSQQLRSNQTSSYVRSNYSIPGIRRMQTYYTIQNVLKRGVEDSYYYYATAAGAPQWYAKDYGEARMLAIGVLCNFAKAEGRLPAFLSQMKTSRDKSLRNSRASWDWCYALKLQASGRKQFYQAIADLSRFPDVEAKVVFLSELPNRSVATVSSQYGLQQRMDRKEQVEPLSEPELKHMLDCFRKVRQERPNWIGSDIVRYLQLELRWASQQKMADDYYAEVTSGATNSQLLMGGLVLAGSQSNMAEYHKLWDRLEPSLVDPTNVAADLPTNFSAAHCPVILELATAKKYDAILAILDHQLSTCRKIYEVQASRSKTSGNRYYSSPYLQVHTAKQVKNVIVDFPKLPNDFVDRGSIQTLRNIYEHYKQVDNVSDLTAHLMKKTQAPSPMDRVFAHLFLSYVAWWDQDRESSVDHMTKACAIDPSASLKLDAAELWEKVGVASEGLKIIDSFQPFDQKLMRRREEIAIRLAMPTGEVERARRAANCLFGLRLDSTQQLQLVEQMRQLGMHDMAELVLGRARRQAGNSDAALLSVMNEFQKQNKLDLAVQIARQLVRRSTSRVLYRPYYYSSVDDSMTQSLQVLSRAGKLQELIQIAETQHKNAPRSAPTIRTLIRYYQTSGNSKRVTELMKEMIELRPKDYQLRKQFVEMLSNQGKAVETLIHYEAMAKIDPYNLLRDSYAMQSAFRQAGKQKQFLDILLAIDFSKAQEPTFVSNLINYMANDAQVRPRTFEIFRKAWLAFPNDHSQLMYYLNPELVHSWPEYYDLGKDAFAINTTEDQDFDRWFPFQSDSNTGRAMSSSSITLLLDVAAKHNRLEELADEISLSLKRYPKWIGGQCILAAINLKLGRTDVAKTAITSLMKENSKFMPNTAKVILFEQAEPFEEMTEIALELGKTSEPDTNRYRTDIYDKNNAQVRVAEIYSRTGRKAEARDVLLKFATSLMPDSASSLYDPYSADGYLSATADISERLNQLGFPVEALMSIRQAKSDPARYQQLLERDYNESQKRIEAAAKKAQSLLKEAPVESALAVFFPAQPKANAKVDLMIHSSTEPIESASLSCMAETLIAAAVAQQSARAKTRDFLHKQMAFHPNDIEVWIASALFELYADPTKSLETLDALKQKTDQTPLESISELSKPNSRQREFAAKQLGLWLVARKCLQINAAQKSAGGEKQTTVAVGASQAEQPAVNSKLAEYGETFGRRALQAAFQQESSNHAIAIFREWGTLAAANGEKKKAEEMWNGILDEILKTREKQRQAAKLKNSRLPVVAPPAQRPRTVPRTPKPGGRTQTLRLPSMSLYLAASLFFAEPLAAPQSTTATRRIGPTGVVAQQATSLSLASSVDPAQFDQAMALAKMAAAKDQLDLSMRIVQQTLVAGPPVQVVESELQRRNRLMSTTTTTADPNAKLITEILELNSLWSAKGADPRKAYEALAAVVLPMQRPREIFVYASPMNPATLAKPISIAGILVERAAQAKQVDDLRRRIAERKRDSMTDVSAQLVLGKLALAANDEVEITKNLSWWETRLEKDRIKNTIDFALHTAMPALLANHPKAPPLVRKSLAALSQLPGDTTAGALYTHLFQSAFAKNDRQGCEELLKEFSGFAARVPVSRNEYSANLERETAFRPLIRCYLQADKITEALEAIAQMNELPTERYNRTRNGSLIVAVCGKLARLPAKERYETLKNFLAPTASRRSYRYFGGLPQDDRAPAIFETKVSTNDGIASLWSLWIQSAKECNCLDEVAEAVKKDCEAKVENAEALYVLVQIAAGKSESVRAVASAMAAGSLGKARQNEGSEYSTTTPEFVLASTMMKDSNLSSIGEEYLNALIVRGYAGDWNDLGLSRRAKAINILEREGGVYKAKTVDPPLKLWNVNTMPSYYGLNLSACGMWLAQGDHLTCFAGPEEQYLTLRSPLTGSFDFSFDLYCDNIQYQYGSGIGAGLFIQTNGNSLNPLGSWDFIEYRGVSQRRADFNRLKIEVRPNKTRCFLNGNLIFEEATDSQTCPWYGLSVQSYTACTFRDLKITGSPVVPSSISLCVGENIDGWSALHSRSLYPRRTFNHPEINSRTLRRGVSTKPESYEWRGIDGVIHGKKMEQAAAYADELLSYFRALEEGDEIQYEFFYKPGEIMVHPALDRIAFLLTEKGVRLRWMNYPYGTVAYNIDPIKFMEEPENSRGPKTLPLKAKEWNKMKVAIHEGAVALTLNDVLVYERPMEPELNRTFGLHHFKDQTSVQVRNITMTGTWPTDLKPEQFADLLAPKDSSTTHKTVRGRNAVIGESVLSRRTPQVLESVRNLPVDQRYEKLLRWVTVNNANPNWRIYGTSGMDIATAASAPDQNLSGAILRLVEVQSPAIELVAAAKQIGKLEELWKIVNVAPAKPANDLRGRLSLRCLVALAMEHADDAKASLADLTANAKSRIESASVREDIKQRNPGQAANALPQRIQPLTPLGASTVAEKLPESEHLRWPEYLAICASLNNPQTTKDAQELLAVLVKEIQSRNAQDLLDQRFLYLESLSKHPLDVLTKVAANRAMPKNWISGGAIHAAKQANGLPAPIWSFHDNNIELLAGCEGNALIHAVPISGDFSVDWEANRLNDNGLTLGYSGYSVRLAKDNKSYLFEHKTHGARAGKLAQELPGSDGWWKCRLIVQKDSAQFFIDGQKVAQQRLSAYREPWLEVRSLGAGNAAIKNLTINGAPTVAKTIELTRGTDLAGWSDDFFSWRPSANVFGNRFGYYESPTTGIVWKKIGHNIRDVDNSRSAVNMERVLYYQRPLLAADSVEYEFYFENELSIAAPILGRTAYLLKPKSIALHRLTLGDFEKSDLSSQNEAPAGAAQRGPEELPFKKGQWNRVKLARKEGAVDIWLNDLLVCEAATPADQNLHFGLFHFSEQSQIQVRNVKLTGNWGNRPTTGPVTAN